MAFSFDINDKIDLLLLRKNGNSFEDFVVKIYKIKYPDILSVKPQGSKGDGSNDAYLSSELLLQVYAPEKLDASKTIKKIDHDFKRAKDYGWDFKEWNFVINDKLYGIHNNIHLKIDDLKKNNPNFIIKLIDSLTLKNMILDQLEKNRLKVYILLNINKDISEFGDFEKVEIIIEAISKERSIRTNKIYKNFSKEKFNPDGIKKLNINIKDKCFLEDFGTYIEKAIEVIEEYKNQIDSDIFSAIGTFITNLYNKYEKLYIPEEALLKTFDEMYNKLENDKNLEIALWVVIAYFFDICDIGKIE